jgi:hypothetical protein
VKRQQKGKGMTGLESAEETDTVEVVLAELVALRQGLGANTERIREVAPVIRHLPATEDEMRLRTSGRSQAALDMMRCAVHHWIAHPFHRAALVDTLNLERDPLADADLKEDTLGKRQERSAKRMALSAKQFRDLQDNATAELAVVIGEATRSLCRTKRKTAYRRTTFVERGLTIEEKHELLGRLVVELARESVELTRQDAITSLLRMLAIEDRDWVQAVIRESLYELLPNLRKRSDSPTGKNQWPLTSALRRVGWDPVGTLSPAAIEQLLEGGPDLLEYLVGSVEGEEDRLGLPRGSLGTIEALPPQSPRDRDVLGHLRPSSAYFEVLHRTLPLFAEAIEAMEDGDVWAGLTERETFG